MKMHLNLIIAALFTVFATRTAAAQTCTKTTPESLSATEINAAYTPGGLLLNAGGTRRVIARLSMEGTHTMRMQLANLQEYATEIALVAPDGSTRWEQKVANQPAFAKMLDLRALAVEPGTYVLLIKAGVATLSQELIAGNKSVAFGNLHHYAAPATPATMAGK
ncbi:MAG: hypothetical protein ABMA02_00030 [Saprospiraceae bacterium]